MHVDLERCASAWNAHIVDTGGGHVFSGLPTCYVKICLKQSTLFSCFSVFNVFLGELGHVNV